MAGLGSGKQYVHTILHIFVIVGIFSKYGPNGADRSSLFRFEKVIDADQCRMPYGVQVLSVTRVPATEKNTVVKYFATVNVYYGGVSIGE